MRVKYSSDWILNAVKDESFGNGHPDPNLVHAREIYDLAMKPDGPDPCTASDGDGDRNLTLIRSINLIQTGRACAFYMKTVHALCLDYRVP